VKIVLVDDHALVMEGLKCFLLSQGMDVVGTAVNSAEAIMQYEVYKPDVVLMDIQMNGCDGIETTRIIKKKYPAAKIVMLTAFEDEEKILAAIQAGAEGYLLKDMEPASFLRQLTGMAAGEPPLAPHVALRLLHEVGQGKSLSACEMHSSGIQLSERQLEVLQLLAEGLTYRKIGKRLGIQETTVKYHVREILVKLGLSNRIQLITYALQEKLISQK